MNGRPTAAAAGKIDVGGQPHRGAVQPGHRARGTAQPQRVAGTQDRMPGHELARSLVARTVEAESSIRESRSAARAPCHNMANSTGSTASGSPTAAAPARSGPGSANASDRAAITAARAYRGWR